MIDDYNLWAAAIVFGVVVGLGVLKLILFLHGGNK